MFHYYFTLALRSLWRNKILTTLMVVAIGIGIGASMTMLTVLHVMTGDPLPNRSAHLYRPYLNPLPLSYKLKPGSLASGPTAALTWPDAKALLDAHKGARQAAMAQSDLVARSDAPGVHAKSVHGAFTTREFFALFGVHFITGGTWSAQNDAQGTPVVVLTQKLAQRLFGTTAAVGKIAHLNKHDFQVVGVVKNWHPEPSFYRINAGYDTADEFFLPVSTAIAMHFSSNWSNGWGKGHNSMTSPTTSWLQFWVQLDTPAQTTAYHRFLINYSAQQKSLGRYQRPASDAKLYDMLRWLDIEGLVPSDVYLQTWLAIGFLIVCMVNIVALLLAKFMRRSGEISVRRALGAKRWDIFQQFGIESAAIGLAGGLLGIGIAELGLWSVRQRPNGYAHLAQMDGQMLVITVALAIVISILAGLLPAWRACRIAPAMQLKTQ